jgi:4-carboxymuconolactone decarboxylase
MDNSNRVASLVDIINRFKPPRFRLERSVALFSAAIAVADEGCIKEAAETARNHGVTDPQLYETILQSYLFLGFPRMLIAAGYVHPADIAPGPQSYGPPVEGEAEHWYKRGLELCKKVYGENFERLRDRVVGMAPDIFRWMLLEGYGKVLSRPGLDIVSREAAIVSCLIVENRPSQLYSHMRGALNVGAPEGLLMDVVEDLGESIGDGFEEARRILRRLKVI